VILTNLHPRRINRLVGSLKVLLVVTLWTHIILTPCLRPRSTLASTIIIGMKFHQRNVATEEYIQ